MGDWERTEPLSNRKAVLQISIHSLLRSTSSLIGTFIDQSHLSNYWVPLSIQYADLTRHHLHRHANGNGLFTHSGREYPSLCQEGHKHVFLYGLEDVAPGEKIRYHHYMTIHVYTIGHSTYPIDEFIRILKRFEIEEVVDVRTIPKSRHNPQFNKDDLREQLLDHAIGYIHLAGLGGLRHTTKTSVNTAWKNASFRGFADYMQTPEFTVALNELIDHAKEKRVAIMCAEAVPWRCHRSLIGDALLIRNVTVEDIFNEKTGKLHSLTPWAKVSGNMISYPGPPDEGTQSATESD